jgi:hypothetical protein
MCLSDLFAMPLFIQKIFNKIALAVHQKKDFCGL